MQGLENQSTKINVMRKSKLLIVFIIGFVSSAQSQSLSLDALVLDKAPTSFTTSTTLIPTNLLKLNFEGEVKNQSIMVQSFDYLKAYHDQLGFFCKAENKASKNATVQLRMRLGSLEYVDRLEGKIR